jgi:hypothetical protein
MKTTGRFVSYLTFMLFRRRKNTPVRAPKGAPQAKTADASKS